MNKYILYAPLALFGFAGLILYYYFMEQSSEGAFRENLVPELIGFCLEGFSGLAFYPTFRSPKNTPAEENSGSVSEVH